MKNKFERAFDKGIKKGILTKNGKKQLLLALESFYNATNYRCGSFYENGLFEVGRLKGFDMHGDVKNKYVLLHTTCSENFKKIHFHSYFFTRRELFVMKRDIDLLLKGTRSKRR